MAASEDLIEQIKDKARCECLCTQVCRISKEKHFGSMFKDDLPEAPPIYSARRTIMMELAPVAVSSTLAIFQWSSSTAG